MVQFGPTGPSVLAFWYHSLRSLNTSQTHILSHPLTPRSSRSDKCLNQYKMQIFCRETEAHLQMHPHLNDLKPASSSGLITPDLWLRDCSQTSEAVRPCSAVPFACSSNKHVSA